MRFEDISTEIELIKYLDNSTERLKERNYIYHYTTLNRCIDIFKSKKWFLSNAQCMNDVLEYNNGDVEKWRNLFFASFMSDADESIGMWSMYSQPWEDGVQIAIPVSKAKDWMKAISEIWEVDCKTFKITESHVKCNSENRVFLSSVAYCNCDNPAGEPEKITWSTAKNTKLRNASHASNLTGYVKDSAWDYEKEIRIKASFENTNNFLKVAIDIPDYVLDSIIITASPLFKGSLKERLEREIERSYTTEVSLFTNRLKLTRNCQECSNNGSYNKALDDAK